MKKKYYKTIKFELADTIGHLILDQPPSNKMTLAFFEELNHLIGFINKSKELKGLIISGNGRHFSSGTDLPAILEVVETSAVTDDAGSHVKIPDFLLKNYFSMRALEQLSFPVVAAIRGACLGSAMELTLFSHFRFCSEDAVFGLPESTFNLIPGLGGISKIFHLSGKARAMELILKGNIFPASEALKYKLVDRIIPKKELIQQSLVFARSISSGYIKDKKKLYLKNFFE